MSADVSRRNTGGDLLYLGCISRLTSSTAVHIARPRLGGVAAKRDGKKDQTRPKISNKYAQVVILPPSTGLFQNFFPAFSDANLLRTCAFSYWRLTYHLSSRAVDRESRQFFSLLPCEKPTPNVCGLFSTHSLFFPLSRTPDPFWQSKM